MEIASIILNFNNYHDTKNCIKSIYQQEKNIEIIIVDNGSTDGSLEKLKKEFPIITYIRSLKNIGFARGNNLGIKYALNGGVKYILLLNNDVVLNKNFLYPLIKHLEEKQSSGIVGGKIYHNNSNIIWAAGGRKNWLNAYAKGIGYGKIDKGQFNNNQNVEYIPGAAVLIRKEVFETVGLLPECYFLGGEELEFALKARKVGYQIDYIYKSTCYHKVGYSGKQIPKYIYNRFRNRLLIIERNYGAVQYKICLAYYVLKNLIIANIISYLSNNYKKRANIAKIALDDHLNNDKITIKHLDKFQEWYDKIYGKNVHL